MEFVDLDKKSFTFDEDFAKEYAKVFSKIKSAELILQRKLKEVISGAPAAVSISIKDYKIAKEKFLRPQKTYIKITDMPDLLRARIVAPINMSLEHFKNRIEKVFNNVTSEYIDNDETGYSGVWHMDIEIDGLKVEVQIVSRGFVPYARHQHKLVYEPKRHGLSVDPSLERMTNTLLQNRLPAQTKALQERLRRYKSKKNTPLNIDDLDAIAENFYLLCK